MKAKGILVVALALLVPALLMAQPKHHPEKPHHGKMMMGKEILSILNEDQLAKWQDIRIQYEKQRNELQAKLKNARLDLQQILHSQRVPDERKLNQKLDEIAKYSDQLKRSRIAQQIEFRKLLTDEQWEKIKELKKKQMHKMPGECCGEQMRHKMQKKQCKEK